MLTESQGAAGCAARVMLCEDDPMIVDLYAMMLESAGHMIVGQSATGDDAIDVAERESPHVALVDLGLGGSMDGVALIGGLRKRNVRSIVLTGNHQRLHEAASAGAEAVMLKPVRFDQLLSAVNQARDAGGPLRPWAD